MLSLFLFIALLSIPSVVAAASTDAVDGARKEGKLVVYTAMQPEDSTKLIE